MENQEQSDTLFTYIVSSWKRLTGRSGNPVSAQIPPIGPLTSSTSNLAEANLLSGPLTTPSKDASPEPMTLKDKMSYAAHIAGSGMQSRSSTTPVDLEVSGYDCTKSIDGPSVPELDSEVDPRDWSTAHAYYSRPALSAFSPQFPCFARVCFLTELFTLVRSPHIGDSDSEDDPSIISQRESLRRALVERVADAQAKNDRSLLSKQEEENLLRFLFPNIPSPHIFCEHGANDQSECSKRMRSSSLSDASSVSSRSPKRPAVCHSLPPSPGPLARVDSQQDTFPSTSEEETLEESALQQHTEDLAVLQDATETTIVQSDVSASSSPSMTEDSIASHSQKSPTDSLPSAESDLDESTPNNESFVGGSTVEEVEGTPQLPDEESDEHLETESQEEAIENPKPVTPWDSNVEEEPSHLTKVDKRVETGSTRECALPSPAQKQRESEKPTSSRVTVKPKTSPSPKPLASSNAKLQTSSTSTSKSTNRSTNPSSAKSPLTMTLQSAPLKTPSAPSTKIKPPSPATKQSTSVSKSPSTNTSKPSSTNTSKTPSTSASKSTFSSASKTPTIKVTKSPSKNAAKSPSSSTVRSPSTNAAKSPLPSSPKTSSTTSSITSKPSPRPLNVVVVGVAESVKVDRSRSANSQTTPRGPIDKRPSLQTNSKQDAKKRHEDNKISPLFRLHRDKGTSIKTEPSADSDSSTSIVKTGDKDDTQVAKMKGYHPSVKSWAPGLSKYYTVSKASTGRWSSRLPGYPSTPAGDMGEAEDDFENRCSRVGADPRAYIRPGHPEWRVECLKLRK